VTTICTAFHALRFFILGRRIINASKTQDTDSIAANKGLKEKLKRLVCGLPSRIFSITVVEAWLP
jgi:hypothetical protein